MLRYKVSYIIDKDESDKKRVLNSVDTIKLFDEIELENIEKELDGVVDDARQDEYFAKNLGFLAESDWNLKW